MQKDSTKIGKPDLFHEVLIIVFQLVKTILHLADDIILGLVVPSTV